MSVAPPCSSEIGLRVPARPEVLQLVRLAATFVASQADMTFEDVADLMLAIDEMCSSLLEPAAARGSELVVDYRWDTDGVEVSCRVAGAELAAREGDPVGVRGLGPEGRAWASLMSKQILTALVDEHALDAGRSGWLRKRKLGALR